MELYFLGKYKKEDAENALLENGFRREEFKVFGASIFRYEKGGFVVNLTSPEEGKIQVQGRVLEDIVAKGKTSEFYEQFEALIKSIGPERIVDCNFNEYFSELLTD